MNKLFTLLLGSTLPLMTTAQTTLYNNGGTISVGSGATLYVRGSLVNAASGTIANSGLLRSTGSTTNDGTMNATGVLLLEGTTAQTLAGSQPVATGVLTVNNPAGVTLATPLRISGAATFTSGIINATASSAWPVIFTATGSVAGTPTDASHVNGFVRKEGTGAFTYPTGDAAKYQPVGTTLTANAGGMTAYYMPGNAGAAPYGTTGTDATPLLYYNEGEYWDLTPVSTATGTVTLYPDGYNNPGTAIPTDLRVAHKKGGQWLNEGGTADGNAITSNAISAWSPFTVGSISLASPLPVQLIAFSGREAGPANLLSWQTAHEDAGTTFTVERSANALDFVAIGTAAGKGNSSSYVLTDGRPLTPLGYYRLKSTDASGADVYSPLVAIDRTAGGAGTVSAYPVPAGRTVTITNTDAGLSGTTATVCDAQGKTVHTFRLEASQSIDLGAWAAGIYYLRAGAQVIRIEKR